MATNETLIPIPGRLHSVATEGHVAGADEIYDDTLQKDQATINAEVAEALGEGGTVDEKIAEAIDDALEDVAFIDDTESSPAVVPGFDPTTDTVHVTAQTLSEQQKAQVRTNIGLNDVDARISEAVASEASQRAAAVSGVQSSVNAEASRAQAAESALQNNIEALTQSDIVVVPDHTQVSSPDATTIYREYGTTSYADWMSQDGGTTWQKMAEYDNAIDDEPTAGSDNLVKSGGVYSKNLSIFNNLIECSDVLSPYFIGYDGTIDIAGAPSYRVAKLHIDGGKYYIKSDIPGSQTALWKYTDSTFTTAEKMLVGNSAIDGFFILDSGYYAISWTSGNSTILNNEAIFTKVDTFRRDIFGTTMCVFDEDEALHGFNFDINGNIEEAVPSYRLVKLYLNAGKYVVCNQGTSKGILWKYTDQSYSTPDQMIIGDSIEGVHVICYLESGYYAFVWNVNYGDTKDNYISNSPALIKVVENYNKLITNFNINNSFKGFTTDDFSVSGTSTKNGYIITLNGDGFTNKAYLNKTFECAKKKGSGTFSTEYAPDFLIGTGQGEEYIRIYNDNNDAKVVCYSGGQIKESINIGFVLVSNVEYRIACEFNDVNTGIDIVVEIIGSDNSYYKHTFSNIGAAFNGAVCFAANYVSTLSNCYVTNQHYYDLRNAKVAIFGHSLIEAYTAGYYGFRDHSFANLIGDAIGKKDTLIFGVGGDNYDGVLNNIRSNINSIENIEYLILCCGANDSSLSAAQIEAKINSIVEECRVNKINPIICTIQPGEDGYLSQEFPIVNEWLRTSGYLIADIDRVFYKNGNIDTTLYLSDGIHPNEQGHRLIFNRIKFDCAYLF